MEKRHQNLLIDNTKFLVDSLDFKQTLLLDNLVTNKVLTPDNKELLEAKQVNAKMASEFVNHILPRRGPKAFEMFIKSLMETEGQEFIAEKLCPELAQKYGSDVDFVDLGKQNPSPIVGPVVSEEQIVAELSTDGSAYRSLTNVSRQAVEDMLRRNVAYSLVHNKRGRAVIINNKVFFDGKTPKREGAERDLEDLKKLFENLFFTVQVQENKSAEEILDIVAKESTEVDHSQYDAFILFVLSHGLNGYVLGRDGKRVKVDDIVSGIGGCQTLINKPKILLFQCCRDDPAVASSQTKNNERDSVGACEGDDGMQLLRHSIEAGSDQNDGVKSNISDYMDTFVAYATLSGFSAMRNTLCGSYFVRYFVYVCCTQGHVEDLVGIMNIVNRLLMRKLKIQVGEMLSKGMLHKIYFFPGYQQTLADKK